MKHDDLPIEFAGDEPLTVLDWIIIALLIGVVGSWFLAGLI